MVIYQLQDELSVLARDKSNATLLDYFGAEFQKVVVPVFEEIMSKLQGLESTKHVETIGGGDRGFGGGLLGNTPTSPVVSNPLQDLETWVKNELENMATKIEFK